MKVIFMGTPDFSVPCLEALCAAGHEVCAVVTQPDKPKGRKMILTPPPVKVAAQNRSIPVVQPETLRGQALLPLLEEKKPDVVVVAAYGKILPSYILEFPRYGCINVHASLLPKHRGAGPIQRVLIDGDKETGVTTMYMEKGLDTGDMLLRDATEISQEDTCETLHTRLSQMGAKLLCQTLELAESGTLQPEQQDDAKASYAPMISKEDGRLDFSQDAQTVYNRARAVLPWPGAFTAINGKQLKLFSVSIGTAEQGTPGQGRFTADTLEITCGDGGTICAKELQLEGAKRMAVRDYLKGHPSDIVALG